jgi:hypothetical protein
MKNSGRLDVLTDKSVEIPTAFIGFFLSIVVEPFQSCHKDSLAFFGKRST